MIIYLLKKDAIMKSMKKLVEISFQEYSKATMGLSLHMDRRHLGRPTQ